MSNVVNHRFVSSVADSADSSLIQPSNWNDGHIFSGGSAGGMLIRDPTDATYGAKWLPGSAAIGVLSTTGVVNDYALGNVGYLRCTNTSLLTLTGISAGVEGQLLRIIAVAGGQVDIPHMDSRSVAANRMYNPGGLTFSLTPGMMAVYIYDAAALWRLVSSSGTVTHMSGPLTAGQAVIGNGGGDLKTGGDLTFSGSVHFTPDNACDIGLSSERPRNLWLGGGQINFPATPNPSASPNVLDDYREGTWTPFLTADGSATGQTYANQLGDYVKVGRHCTVNFNLTLSAKGTLTGIVYIGGLPFPWSASLIPCVGPFYFANLATTWIVIGAVNTFGAATTFQLRGQTAASGTGFGATLSGTDITNTTAFIGTFTYLTNS